MRQEITTKMTPDQERSRKREIKKCSNDWEYYTPTLEIRRKIKKGFAGLIEKLWRRKYKVKILYLWVSEIFAQPNMMSYDSPFTHDNIKKPKNMSFIFALHGGWSIPDRDLKTLTHGPLLSEAGEVLVKEGGQLSYYWNKWWPVIAALATLLGLIRSIAWLLGKG